MPFGEEGSFIRSPSRLGLLSIEQTLADYATLILEIKRRYNASNSPVISVGGSLAGSLTFFLRAKYPSVVDMGIAASAPILGYPGLASAYGWYQVATRTFETQSPGCPDRVRHAFSLLLQNAHDPPLITRTYNTCTPANKYTGWSLAQRLTGELASMAGTCVCAASLPCRFSPSQCFDIATLDCMNFKKIKYILSDD